MTEFLAAVPGRGRATREGRGMRAHTTIDPTGPARGVGRPTTGRIIEVRMAEGLIDQLDFWAHKRGVTRAVALREAARLLVSDDGP